MCVCVCVASLLGLYGSCDRKRPRGPSVFTASPDPVAVFWMVWFHAARQTELDVLVGLGAGRLGMESWSQRTHTHIYTHTHTHRFSRVCDQRSLAAEGPLLGFIRGHRK